MKHRVIVETMFRPEINDPNGQALHGALKGLGFDGISSVRQGKIIELEIECEPDEINEQVTAMCKTILANPVTEAFQFNIINADKT